MVCTIWKGMGIHIFKVEEIFHTDRNSHEFLLVALGFWTNFPPYNELLTLFAVVVWLLELPKRTDFCSHVSESFNWNKEKRIWRFFCCCSSSYGRPLNILKWNVRFRIKLTNCGSGPWFCSSPPKQKWFCCIHDLVILSWLFDAKIFLFLFCFDRWRQLRSQATTEISGRLFPAFRWSLFTRRKINIHSGNLSSFLQRAQMWLEVFWRRSLHAHLLSQQMLLQSYRVVNQQNVLLFPDFPFLM